MRGDWKGKRKQEPDHASADAQARGRKPTTEAAPIDDVMLREYLLDALAPEVSARVEKALRDSAELRARLEDVRQNRADGQLHTLGAIWHRTRLTCPSRQQLGSYLLEALDPAFASYLTFHIEIVECPFCKANLDDLRMQTQTASRRLSVQEPSAPHPAVKPAPAE